MIRRIILSAFVAIGCLTSSSFGQYAGLPLDEEVSGLVQRTASTESGNFYTLEAVSRIGFRTADLNIRQWNGLFWVNLKPLHATEYLWDEDHNLQFGTYNNQIIIAGSFKGPNGINGVATWNGQDWLPLGGGINSDYVIHDEISINSFAQSGNDLVVCGRFNLADGDPVQDLAVYDGNNWTGVTSDKGTFRHLYTVGDTVYLSGTFTQVGGISTNNLAGYTNGNWFPITHAFGEDIISLASFNNELVVITSNGFFARSQSGWQEIGDGSVEIEEVYSTAEVDGQLFVSGKFVSKNGTDLSLISIDDATSRTVVKTDELKLDANAELFVNVIDDYLYLSGNFTSKTDSEVLGIIIF